MRKTLVVAGIVVIAIGKVLLAGGILSQIGLQQCQALDTSAIAGPKSGMNAASCFDDPFPYLAASGILLAIGAFTLIYGLRWKKAVTTNA